MTISIDLSTLLSFKPCDADTRTALFTDRKTITVAQAIDARVSVANILWVVAHMGHTTECVKFALACSRRVEHLNTDPRVKAANDVCEAWLNNPTDTARAAYAAADAARAAYAAYAAARAAEKLEQIKILLELFK